MTCTRRRGSITVQMISSLTVLNTTGKENVCYECCKAAESEPFKLDTSHTVILPFSK